MALSQQGEGVFERLMALHREVSDGAHFDTAYHLLAAALHYAQDAGDREQVLRVQSAAQEQLNWIDKHAPAYQHSTQSASSRGHVSIFTLLVQQAHARVTMMQRLSDRPGLKKKE